MMNFLYLMIMFFNMYYFLNYSVLDVKLAAAPQIQLLVTQHKNLGSYIEILLQDLDPLV